MHDEIGARELRWELRQVLDRIAAGGRRVMILRNGKEAGALVSPSDLRALEAADNSRMEYHERMQEAKLRELRWLKEGLDDMRTDYR